MASTPFEDEKAVLAALRVIAKMLGKDKEEEFESFIKEQVLSQPRYKREPGLENNSKSNPPKWIQELGRTLHDVYRAGFDTGMKLSSLMPPDPSANFKQFLELGCCRLMT